MAASTTRTHSPASVSHPTNGRSSKAIEIAGRVGYATKGIIYLIVGGLAAAAAWGAGGQTTGSKGAIATIASQPFGQVLLWIVAVGLAAYCVWRLVEAVVDPDGEGSDARGIAVRVGFALSGLVYGALAWTAAPVSASSAQSGGAREGAVSTVLSWPGGSWIVTAVGVAVIVYGLFLIYKGLADKFMDKFNPGRMGPTERKVALYAGRLGLAARGVTFGVIGIFVAIAGWTLDPDETKGVGEALDVLASQPYGAWILLLVAIGLACFGLFCLIQARYRDFDTR